MSSLAVYLGMIADPATPGLDPHNMAPFYVLFHFMFAYVFLSARVAKGIMKIDHNINPRLDLNRYGERAVTEGKMTKRQLNFLQRNESCHANSVEHFAVFAASVTFATVNEIPSAKINTACVIYTTARIVYAVAYLTVERVKYTYVRSLAWWVSNIVCINLLWSAGKAVGMVEDYQRKMFQ